MDTIQPFFWEMMIGSVSSGFANLVVIRERLEEGIKNGKIANAAKSSSGARKSSRNFQSKNEGEINVISSERRPYCRQQYYDQPYVAAVAPVVNAPPAQAPQQ